MNSTIENLFIHQYVLVDSIKGWIQHIHPNGKSPYIGPQHAYIWVRTPELDYVEHNGIITINGRAVPFNDISKRIQII